MGSGNDRQRSYRQTKLLGEYKNKLINMSDSATNSVIMLGRRLNFKFNNP